MSFDVDQIIERLSRLDLLEEDIIYELCSKVRSLFLKEANVISVAAPVTVVGDIHGQFHDLLEIFIIAGAPPHKNYLFLGDLIDRGSHCLETVLLVFAYKIRYPSMVNMIRGNHECRELSQTYGTYKECLTKYGHVNVWLALCDVFDWLPIAASIGNGGIFAVHGGLSPEAKTMDQIDTITRNIEIPHTGPFSDLTWSDPTEDIDDWGVSPRGAGFLFGQTPLNQFHHTNSTSLVVRAHQLVMEGFQYLLQQKLLTVWSAPNYCYNCGNVAAILELDDYCQRSFKVFSCAPGVPIQI